ARSGARAIRAPLRRASDRRAVGDGRHPAAGRAAPPGSRGGDHRGRAGGSLMSIPIFTVDAFADRMFAGNPAGVCLLDQAAEAPWMRGVAREMSLSHTWSRSPRQVG